MTSLFAGPARQIIQQKAAPTKSSAPALKADAAGDAASAVEGSSALDKRRRKGAASALSTLSSSNSKPTILGY